MKLKILLITFLLVFASPTQAESFVNDYTLSDSSKDRCLPGNSLRVTYDEKTSHLELGQDYGGVYIVFADYSYDFVNQGELKIPYITSLGEKPSIVENKFVELEDMMVFSAIRSSLQGVIWFKAELIFKGSMLELNLGGLLEVTKECSYELVQTKPFERL